MPQQVQTQPFNRTVPLIVFAVISGIVCVVITTAYVYPSAGKIRETSLAPPIRAALAETDVADAGELADGDIVRAENDYKVYIIKQTSGQWFKRWVPSAEIFSFYPHLAGTKGKIVDALSLEAYADSTLVRQDGTEAVWSVNTIEPGLRADKTLIPNAEAFTDAGFSWDQIYTVNEREAEWYRDAGLFSVLATPAPSPPGPSPIENLSPTPPPATIPTAAPSPTPGATESPSPTPTQSPQPSPSAFPSATGVTSVLYYGNGNITGFSPSEITVRKGAQVRFQNASGQIVWLAANPHPTHTDLPALNLGSIQPNQTKSYTFDTVGNWGYHNHYQPQYSGMVHVQ